MKQKLENTQDNEAKRRSRFSILLFYQIFFRRMNKIK